MSEQTIGLPKKPSFTKTVTKGITGFFKGGLVGAGVGAVVGGVVGIIIPPFGIAGAILGAAVGATSIAGIGALAGTVTGVVKSREAGQVNAEDVVNVAKISFAQGVATGQSGHVQRLEAQRAMMQERQITH